MWRCKLIARISVLQKMQVQCCALTMTAENEITLISCALGSNVVVHSAKTQGLCAVVHRIACGTLHGAYT